MMNEAEAQKILSNLTDEDRRGFLSDLIKTDPHGINAKLDNFPIHQISKAEEEADALDEEFND